MASLVGNPVLTTRGRAALLGGDFEVTSIALGDDGSWTPTGTSNALQSEAQRLTPQVQVEQLGTAVRLHVTANDPSDASYTVREFALLGPNGDVLAIHAQAEDIATKAPSSTLLIAQDLSVSDARVDDIVLGDTNYQLPIATEETAGIARRATTAEVMEGTVTTEFVTPAALQTKLDDALMPGRYMVDVPMPTFHASPEDFWTYSADRGISNFGSNTWKRIDGVIPLSSALANEIRLPARTLVRRILVRAQRDDEPLTGMVAHVFQKGARLRPADGTFVTVKQYLLRAAEFPEVPADLRRYTELAVPDEDQLDPEDNRHPITLHVEIDRVPENTRIVSVLLEVESPIVP